MLVIPPGDPAAIAVSVMGFPFFRVASEHYNPVPAWIAKASRTSF
jgi:hypothetical protein